MRTCKDCKEDLPLTMFYFNRKQQRHFIRCKRCCRRFNQTAGHIVASKKWRHNNPEAAAELTRNWRAENPKANPAHALVYYYVKKGVLVRPEACEKCGSTRGKMEAHHVDYDQPLVVQWLCRRCHSITKQHDF